MLSAVQVDTSAANSTSEGLMWLRLVQSARDKEEQNLEAYVKNGQLLYRSLRRIEKDEELLVWYGKDLIDLLLLSSSRAPTKSKGEQTEPGTGLPEAKVVHCWRAGVLHMLDVSLLQHSWFKYLDNLVTCDQILQNSGEFKQGRI
ncbi:hypothetical protein ATANTOWER_031815 [Ataeniobius toweri]|uniref:SET domain-containing protein n=1 Tax=Ataeniobius toweri TaxID=208326 RepID=A0ABU7ALY1_9TELE|nr:hypothetical protein [Ataeniobius toweri]